MTQARVSSTKLSKHEGKSEAGSECGSNGPDVVKNLGCVVGHDDDLVLLHERNPRTGRRRAVEFEHHLEMGAYSETSVSRMQRAAPASDVIRC